MVVAGYRQQQARPLIHWPQLVAHLHVCRQRRKARAKGLEIHAHGTVIKHAAQMEGIADRITVIGNLGDEGAGFQEQAGVAGHHAELIGALER